MAELRIAAPPRIAPVQAPDPRSAGEVAGAVSRLAGTVQQVAADENETDQRILDEEARLERIRVEEEDRRLTLSSAADLATRAERLRTRAAELRLQAGPGAAGYEEALAAEIDSELASFDLQLGGNTRVGEQFADNIAQIRGRLLGEARVETMRAVATQQGADFDALRTTAINGVMRTPTMAQMAEAQGLIGTALAGLTGLTAEQRSAAAREANQQLVMAMGLGLNQSGADGQVTAMIDQGVFDAVLDPEQIGLLRRQTETAARAREAEAERQAREGERAAKEAADLLKARVAAGEAPADGEFAAVEAALAAAGVEADERYDFAVVREDVATNRALADADASALGRERVRIEGRVAAGSATQAERRLLQRIGPMEEARRRGETARYRDTFNSGLQGQAQAAAQIAADTSDPAERFRRAEALQDGFGYIVSLPEQFRGAAITGRAQMTADRTVAPLPAVRSNFTAYTGGTGTVGALRAFDPVAQQGVQETAAALYVGRGGRFSEDGAPLNPQGWRMAVTNALGGSMAGGVQRGGLAITNGERFVLPSFMTADRFNDLYQNHGFAGARYADGSNPTRSDIIARFFPVYIGDDDQGNAQYNLEFRRPPNSVGPAARLKNAEGGDYLMTVTR